MNKVAYVLGFVFVGENKLLLQRKNRGKDFMLGKLNGLGGKIEKRIDHSPKHAMSREYVEETSDTRNMNWEYKMFISYINCEIYIFVANVDENFYANVKLEAKNDPNSEELLFVELDKQPVEEYIYNLSNILKLIMDK